MYKRKKALYFGLSLITVLGACGPEDSADNEGDNGSTTEPGETEDITLLFWGDEPAESFRAFEEEHGVTIEVVEDVYAESLPNLRIDGPGGTGPDVFAMPHADVGTAVTEGILYQLDIPEDILSAYNETALQSQMADGNVYGIPYAVETTLLFYNKDLVDEENLPETLDEWYELSEELVSETDNYGFLALWDQIYYAQSIMSGYGGYVFGLDEEGNYDVMDIGLNNSAAIEAAEYIQRFYEEGIFPSGIIGEQGIDTLDGLFSEGRVAAVISGPWNTGPYADAGVDYGVSALPYVSEDQRMSSFMGAKGYHVSTYSEYPELAQELILFLTNEENALARYNEFQEIPAVESLVNDPVIAENETSQALAEQSLYAELLPGVPEMNEVWGPVDSALQTIAIGSAEPEQALNEAVNTVLQNIEMNHAGE